LYIYKLVNELYLGLNFLNITFKYFVWIMAEKNEKIIQDIWFTPIFFSSLQLKLYVNNIKQQYMSKIFRLILALCVVMLVVSACKSNQKVAENLSAGNKNTNGRPKVVTSSYYGFAQPSGRFSTSGGIGGATAPKAAEPTVKRVTLVEEEQATPEESITSEIKSQVESKKSATAKKPVVVKKPARKVYIDEDDTANAAVESVPVVVKKRVKSRTESVDMADEKSSSVDGKFHVVVGSFNVKSNANSLLESLKSEGVKDAKVVVNEQGLYRVVLASYDGYQQARSKAETVASKYADAWVLIQGKVTGKVRHTAPRAESMGS
jgi:cell division septation protein DedD